MDTTEKVRESLKAAKENGYDMTHLSPLQVAIDLMTYDSDLEHEDVCEVADAVHNVRLNF